MSAISSLTGRLIADSRPLQAGGHLLSVPGMAGRAIFHTGSSRLQFVPETGSHPPQFDAAEPLRDKADGRLHALSLAVAQQCNLGCTYCYAQQGGFGTAAKQMKLETALKAVDALLADAREGETATLAFMGGEPLMARDIIREATRYAARRADERCVQMNFSLTTNGTLLTSDDGLFFEEHGFAVTVSIDGVGETHNALRPTKGGSGSYERILERVQPLLSLQRRMQVSVRATVTPLNLGLVEMLNEFVRLGFHSVGFSPMLSAPNGQHEMDGDALERMLAEMVYCGLRFEQAITSGERFPFLNMVNAMRELHSRARRPRPCGAASGYLGMGADGTYAACHRFVGDEAHSFGSLEKGLDAAAQHAWQTARLVDTQEPCRSCWARYLCGGGCHYEVIHKGRTACDFIRGWLHYCLQAYARLSGTTPEYFSR